MAAEDTIMQIKCENISNNYVYNIIAVWVSGIISRPQTRCVHEAKR